MRLIRLVPFVALFGCASACGGTSSDDSPGVPLEELPAKYAESLCTAYSACAGVLLDVFVPGEDCVKNTTTRIKDEFPAIEDAVASGRARYNGKKAQACFDEIAARSCADLLERESAACSATLDGTLAVGEECSIDEECEGEAYCNFADSCPGVCSKLEALGKPCQGDSNCVSGLVCPKDTERCATPAAEGELCNQGEPDCAPGNVCLGDDKKAKTPGNCVTISDAFSAKAGEACDLKSGLCAPDNVCQVTEVVLGPPVTLTTSCEAKAKSGGDCRLSLPDPCPSDQFCKLPVLMLDGTCTVKPPAGEPCVNNGFDPQDAASICAPGTRCDNGVCHDLASLGDPCTVDDTCYSGRCNGAACVASNGCE